MSQTHAPIDNAAGRLHKGPFTGSASLAAGTGERVSGSLLPSLCLPGLGPPSVDGSLLLMASALPPRSMITYSMAVNLKGSAEDLSKWIAMKLLQLRLVQGSVGLNHTPIVSAILRRNASQSSMTQSSPRLIACVRVHLPRILGWDDPER